ncbi:MAG: response regulator [Candidatus Omnitrophica bacterium]|nr:response regulator [Candidatus Omnitrophota bacterium]
MKNKILIVDDEKDITLVLKEFFVSKGYEVLAAFNGREAMGFLNQPGIGLILLDIQMPDMSGIEILKEAKKIYKDAKVVILTGFSEECKEEVENIGCDVFLTKPFSVKTLITVIESVLAGKEDTGKNTAALMDNSILARAKLLFIEPNEITYSPKLAYFRDLKRSKGRYQMAAAFTEDETLEKLEEFKPDIVLSDISVFRLYKLSDKLLRMKDPAKDIILYGFSQDTKDLAGSGYTSFVGDLFDPVAAIVSSEEMDRLGRIVRQTAVGHGLYKSTETANEQFYNYHKTLLEASKGMVLITDTRKLLYLIVYVVKKHMKLKSACIFYYDENDKGFILRSKRGEENVVQKGYKIEEDHALIKWLKDKRVGFLYNKNDFASLPDLNSELEKLGCVACVPSFNKGKLIGFLILGNKISGDLYTKEELELLLTISNEVAIVIENAKNLLELQKLREKEKESSFQIILALAKTVDEKDSYTRGHLEEVTKYGMVVAEELADSVKMNIDMDELKTALLLHDIGKIGVPDALLHKPSSLTPEEFEIMKQHTEIGARILEPIKKLKKVGKIIRHHQEKCDGTGYPDGLKGEGIPVEARIISVVDAYHAMTSDRPYRKALPEEAALNELKNKSGTQFDTEIVEAFMKAYKKGKIVKHTI